MNPVEPESPELESIVRRIAADDPLETHPAAAALQTYDEDPESLAPRTREWIESHLAACSACAAALRAVPRLDLRPHPLGRRLWPIAAAAGWILAAYLGFGPGDGAREPREPFLSAHSLVLSTQRGDGATIVPAEARVLRLALVLGEEVPLGARLRIRIEDAAGRTLLDEEREVAERNERDWPILTLDRAALPGGTTTIRVRTPSGLESVFELGL